MKQSFLAKLRRLMDRREIKRKFTLVTNIICCMIVFCITYVLISPVVTQEWQAVCGMEEHTHTEECYAEVPVEDEEESGDEGGALAEEAATTGSAVSVSEKSSSRKTKKVLICTLEEHTHSESCYYAAKPEEEEEYICGLNEHTHTSECYFENGELKCTQQEHLHTAACLASGENPVDETVEEMSGGIVPIDREFTYENEYITATVAITGKIRLPETIETAAAEETTADAADSDDAVAVNDTADVNDAPDVNDAETQGDTAAEENTGLYLDVVESEDMDDYSEYEEMAEEDGDVMLLQVFDYSLKMNGEKISLKNCTVDATITAKPELQEMMDAPQAAMYAAEESESAGESVNNYMELTTYTEEKNVMAYAVVEAANPSFTVQYYANIQRAVKTDIGATVSDPNALARQNKLLLINTDNGSTAANSNKGGKMPKNGTGVATSPNDNPLSYLELVGNRIKTQETLTEIYKSEELTYQRAPGLMYFNIVLSNTESEYQLKEIWVLKPGRNADSIKRDDWEIHEYTTTTRFTNRPETAAKDSNYILIDDNAVIRLVYNPEETTENMPAHFYDYDITGGKLYQTSALSGSYYLPNELDTALSEWGNVYLRSSEEGINSNSNYQGSGSRLAFGNANMGTKYGKATWDGNALNTANRATTGGKDSFRFSTFGLVTGLSGGKLQYNTGVDAPKLFNEGSAAGKTNYDNNEYSLDFQRVGDTYTLSAVRGAQTASKLDEFRHPQSKHNHIWTNDFWPMDSAPSWGAYDSVAGVYHDPKIGSSAKTSKVHRQLSSGENWDTIAENDDAKDHNSYFGMQYSVTFDLSSSYIGPLEYYFFGDDDMWVFLNDQLVCDIGGVHSAVGEYVNLWDYIDRSQLLDEKGNPIKEPKKDANGDPIPLKDKNGNPVFDADGNPEYEMTDKVQTYTLSFFYTERGASGSTCWMQFTLPTVAGIDLDSVLDEQLSENTGSLSIEKKLQGVENTEWFEFDLQFEGADDNYEPDYRLRDANGNLVDNEELSQNNDYVIADGSRFRIRAGDVLVIRNLPKDATFQVTELNCDGYQPVVTIDGAVQDTAPVARGTITVDKRTQVVFTNVASYELPATGGSGTANWYIMGAALCMMALALGYKKVKVAREEGGTDM